MFLIFKIYFLYQSKIIKKYFLNIKTNQFSMIIYPSKDEIEQYFSTEQQWVSVIIGLAS
jgi:hypothetical protein